MLKLLMVGGSDVKIPGNSIIDFLKTTGCSPWYMMNDNKLAINVSHIYGIQVIPDEEPNLEGEKSKAKGKRKSV